MNQTTNSPLYWIAQCPVCGGGLLGVRLCHGDPTGKLATNAGNRHVGSTTDPHGLIICDECEAIWRHPDLQIPHEYPAAEDAKCPRCQTDLWQQSHWASLDEVSRLGWAGEIHSGLDNDTPSDSPQTDQTPVSNDRDDMSAT